MCTDVKCMRHSFSLHGIMKANKMQRSGEEEAVRNEGTLSLEVPMNCRASHLLQWPLVLRTGSRKGLESHAYLWRPNDALQRVS
jgi:hypothetical protein